MIEIVKDYNDKYDIYYKIIKDNNDIGYIGVLFDSINIINIFVKNNYQGYGYGSKSFDLVLNELKNIYKIIITIPSDNIKMLRIVNHYKNIIINKNDDLITYSIINEKKA